MTSAASPPASEADFCCCQDGGAGSCPLVGPPRGDQGFAYDPMFLPDGFERTFGEMSADEKHGLPPRGKGLSHRARAFVQLAKACLT